MIPFENERQEENREELHATLVTAFVAISLLMLLSGLGLA
jgi:hypothetical protein